MRYLLTILTFFIVAGCQNPEEVMSLNDTARSLAKIHDLHDAVCIDWGLDDIYYDHYGKTSSNVIVHFKCGRMNNNDVCLFPLTVDGNR